MRLLVTGGAGFIGSHLVQHILEGYADYEVVALDALTYAGSLENLAAVRDHPHLRFVHGRIEDGALVDELMTGVDVVVNLAAESYVDRSIAQPQVFVQTNVVGTQVLLDAARRHGVRLFCQVSTDEVYGDIPLDSPLRFSEEAPLKPSSPYAASKAAADLLALAYHRTYGLPVVISRCTNNYGPRQYPEKFLPTVILNALAGRPVPIYGDGCYVRDWLHVADHCRAIDLILHHGRPGEIYNVSAYNEWPNIELARHVLTLLARGQELLRHVADRPGHDRRYAVDASKIRDQLGWRPLVDFAQGLRETVDWYARRQTAGLSGAGG